MSRLDYEYFDQKLTWGLDTDYEAHEFAKADYVIYEIKKRQEKAKAKQDQINELTYERNLIIEDTVRTIKEDLANSKYNIFWGLSTDLMHKAWVYHWHKKDKEYWDKASDKEGKKSYKSCYDYVLSTIKHRLLKDNDEYKLVEIIDHNYCSSYCFTYKYKKHEIQITVPIWSNASFNNYQDLLVGYKVHFKEREHCWNWVCGGINYLEVANELELWINNKTKEQE